MKWLLNLLNLYFNWRSKFNSRLFDFKDKSYLRKNG